MRHDPMVCGTWNYGGPPLCPACRAALAERGLCLAEGEADDEAHEAIRTESEAGAVMLYDQVREHAERLRAKLGRERFGELNMGNLNSLRRAVVYEVSDVVPLFGDWERERGKAVPKRPPHLLTWVEWRYHDYTADGAFGDSWTLAAFIGQMQPEPRAQLLADPPPLLGGGSDIREMLLPEKEVYMVQMFKRLDSFRRNPDGPDYEQGVTQNKQMLHEASVDMGTFVWSQNPQGDGIHRHKLVPQFGANTTQEEVIRRCSLFFLPVVGSFGVRNWQCSDPWPAFMAFALLHCKNVVEECVESSEKVQRQCHKHGRPPRCSYRVLKIEIPQVVSKDRRLRLTDSAEGPGVRFHLCSGHFKNLQHDRFKHKGWHWWPAHWRGSRALGRVEKSFRMVADV